MTRDLFNNNCTSSQQYCWTVWLPFLHHPIVTIYCYLLNANLHLRSWKVLFLLFSSAGLSKISMAIRLCALSYLDLSGGIIFRFDINMCSMDTDWSSASWPQLLNNANSGSAAWLMWFGIALTIFCKSGDGFSVKRFKVSLQNFFIAHDFLHGTKIKVLTRCRDTPTQDSTVSSAPTKDCCCKLTQRHHSCLPLSVSLYLYLYLYLCIYLTSLAAIYLSKMLSLYLYCVLGALRSLKRSAVELSKWQGLTRLRAANFKP